MIGELIAAVVLISFLAAVVLHPIVFPLDEHPRDLGLDERLLEVAANGARELREEQI